LKEEGGLGKKRGRGLSQEGGVRQRKITGQLEISKGRK